MTREEAIIILTNIASFLRDGTRYLKPEHEKQFREAYEMAIKALEQPESHWIPCSERLPEREEQVLIYAWNVHFVLAKYREIRTWEGEYIKTWVTEDAYSVPHEIKHEVLAWMPLPEPYEERRGEQE